MNLLHVYGNFARQDWSCRWGRKNMDLVPKTGFRRGRTVRSFDRLWLVDLITLLLLRLGVSLILRRILLALRLGGGVSVCRLLGWLIHCDRLGSSSS